MAKKNQEILEQVVATATAETQTRLANVDLKNGAEVYSVLQDYPTTKNEFISTLTNKIVGSKTYSKIYENQLKMLHKGKLDWGVGLSQIFVEMCESKGFLDHFDSSAATPEADLIRKLESDVKEMFIERNFRLKYKTSVSDAQLRSAFVNATGLNNLINNLVSRNASSAEYKEFNMMKQILESSATLRQLKETATGELELSETVLPIAKQPMHQVIVGDFASDKKEWADNFTETIRSLAGRMKFPSRKYNMVGVNTWCDTSDLVLVTTPEVGARLDVRTLAQAFNVSEAELNIRVILVDELPKQFASDVSGSLESKECYGILMDCNHVQFYDTVIENGNFYNPDQLTTNLFLHRQGLASLCGFCNAVALVKE